MKRPSEWSEIEASLTPFPTLLLTVALLLLGGCDDRGIPLAPDSEQAFASAVGAKDLAGPCVVFVDSQLVPVGSRTCSRGADGLRVRFVPAGSIQFWKDGVPLHQGFYRERGNTALNAWWHNGRTLSGFGFIWMKDGEPTDRGDIPLATIGRANSFMFTASRIRHVQFTTGGHAFGAPVRVGGPGPHKLVFFYPSY